MGQLGRCFGSNGAGIAQCNSFFNDTLAFCHSFGNSSNLFECAVQDDCSQIGDDWIAYEPLLTWGWIFLLVIGPCSHCCFYCGIGLCGIGKPIDEIKKMQVNSQSIPIFITIVGTLSVFVIILAYSQISYEKTLYGIIGLALWVGLLIELILICIGSCSETTTEKTSNVTALDVYQDLSNPHAVVLTTSICQVTLLYMYFHSLITQGPPDFSKRSTYGFYALGAFIQIAVASRQQVQSSDPTDVQIVSEFKFWSTVSKFADEKSKLVTFMLEDKNEKDEEEKNEDVETGEERNGSLEDAQDMAEEDTAALRREFFSGAFQKAVGLGGVLQEASLFSRSYRLFLSILINVCGKQVVLYLLPIQLAHSESAMDFILNSVAAYFIIELDDYKEGKKIILTKESDETEALLQDGGEVESGEETTEDNKPSEDLDNDKKAEVKTEEEEENGGEVESGEETTEDNKPSEDLDNDKKAEVKTEEEEENGGEVKSGKETTEDNKSSEDLDNDKKAEGVDLESSGEAKALLQDAECMGEEVKSKEENGDEVESGEETMEDNKPSEDHDNDKKAEDVDVDKEEI